MLSLSETQNARGREISPLRRGYPLRGEERDGGRIVGGGNWKGGSEQDVK